MSFSEQHTCNVATIEGLVVLPAAAGLCLALHCVVLGNFPVNDHFHVAHFALLVCCCCKYCWGYW